MGTAHSARVRRMAACFLRAGRVKRNINDVLSQHATAPNVHYCPGGNPTTRSAGYLMGSGLSRRRHPRDRDRTKSSISSMSCYKII